jgi:hypothetical protein
VPFELSAVICEGFSFCVVRKRLGDGLVEFFYVCAAGCGQGIGKGDVSLGVDRGQRM